MRRAAVPVRVARFPDDAGTVRELFREYAASLDIDLAFQGFAAELDALPGAYAEPAGRVLLAVEGSEALGCVALRPLGEGACEMKRLYVRPGARGRGVGERLVGLLLEAARQMGYQLMRLDTLASMTPALQLYAKAGFRPIPAYIFNPIPDACFLECRLWEDAPARDV